MNARSSPASWRGLADLRPFLCRKLGGRCRDENELDDLVQETLIRAARYRDSLADPGRLESWVLRIAWNVFRDHLKREQRLPRRERAEELLLRVEGREPAPGECLDEPDVEVDRRLVERGAVLRHMARAFDGLQCEDRRVLGDYYSRGSSCAATAERFGIAPNMVKVRLFRARRRLRVAVERRLARERLARLAPVEVPG